MESPPGACKTPEMTGFNGEIIGKLEGNLRRNPRNGRFLVVNIIYLLMVGFVLAMFDDQRIKHGQSTVLNHEFRPKSGLPVID